MTALPDRASGLFFLPFGLAMYFLLVPAQTETGYDGHLLPYTMPNFLSWMMAICGALLIVKPSDQGLDDKREFFNGGLFAAVWAMSQSGLAPVAPVLAFLIMVLSGERGPFWLAVGTLAVSATIWVLVTQILERALP